MPVFQTIGRVSEASDFKPGPFEDDWQWFLGEYNRPDPPDNWFHPVFRPLVVAAAENGILRRLYPYQAMNQLAFSHTDPPSDELPAVGAGSTGWYAVVSHPGPSGEAILETDDVQEAVAKVADLIASQPPLQ